jgi:predicted HNH restriction endonuclease
VSSRTKEGRHAYYLRIRDTIPKWESYSEEKKQRLLEYQREYRKKNREKITEKKREKRRSKLLTLIGRKGGKCSICSGTFDPCVYDFHHTNPADKEFTIGENMNIPIQKLLSEVDKCILVCANCHRLLHKVHHG